MNNKTDNGRSLEAQKVRQESEFIKRIEDFARYMAPEYINGSDNPRSLMIIAADCIDRKSGKHALTHIMLGDDRVGRCALRSMMEDNDAFAALVHELCEDDGGNRPVEDLDEEIARRRKRLTISMCSAGVVAAWSVALVVLLASGMASWMTTVSSLLLMAICGMFIGCDIRTLRSDLARLRRQRKRAAGRQKIMSRISQFANALRQFRNQMEEDAGEDDDD